MKMNRRNVLIVIGAIVIVGGAALGTGAFSQVQADRSVTVQTAEDSNALLGLEENRTDYAELNGGEMEVNLSDANTNATTTVDGVFDIRNNGDETIELDNSWSTSSNDIQVTLTPDETSLNSGDKTSVELEVITDGAQSDAELDETITINATET